MEYTELDAIDRNSPGQDVFECPKCGVWLKHPLPLTDPDYNPRRHAERVGETVDTLRRVRALRRGKHPWDIDLVVVSDNHSVVNDFCDAYRGRIYSLNGYAKSAPLLWSLPNGGPPFHKGCRHSIQVYAGRLDNDRQAERRAQTDPRFLEVDARLASERWRALSQEERQRISQALE